MILLGGIELPDLVWEGEFEFTGVAASVDFSLGGTPMVWEGAREGRPIDLVGGEDTAWISRSALESLKALAAVPLGVHTLDFEGTAYMVRFRHEEPPVISAEQVLPSPEADASDRFMNLRIRLMEV